VYDLGKDLGFSSKIIKFMMLNMEEVIYHLIELGGCVFNLSI